MYDTVGKYSLPIPFPLSPSHILFVNIFSAVKAFTTVGEGGADRTHGTVHARRKDGVPKVGKEYRCLSVLAAIFLVFTRKLRVLKQWLKLG